MSSKEDRYGERGLRVDEILGLLTSTVPLLEELIDGVAVERLHAVTECGWSVNDQLAHLRACHDVLGGNMLRIVREDHPAWMAMSPRAWQKQTDYFEWQFGPRVRGVPRAARRSSRSSRRCRRTPGSVRPW